MTSTTPASRAVRPLLVLPLLLLLVAAFLAGCGPGADDEPSSAGGNGGTSEEAPAAQDAAVGSPGGLRDSDTEAGLQRAVVATGEVRVDTRHVERARDEALRLTRAWGGLVADEQTSSDPRQGALSATLVLRVPAPRFDRALEELAGLGAVTDQTRSAQDVTTQVLDTAARVRAAERSIRSIERLLSRATRLGEVIRIESDLARRQADLDSLRSQQAYLADQTSLSTVTLHLQRAAAPGRADEARGFLAGLEQGWEAMSRVGVASTTVLGAVLPFAALLALVGTPLALVLRRRRTSPAEPAAPVAG